MTQSLRVDAQATSSLPRLEGTVLGAFRISDLLVAATRVALSMLQACSFAEVLDAVCILICFLCEYFLTGR